MLKLENAISEINREYPHLGIKLIRYVTSEDFQLEILGESFEACVFQNSGGAYDFLLLSCQDASRNNSFRGNTYMEALLGCYVGSNLDKNKQTFYDSVSVLIDSRSDLELKPYFSYFPNLYRQRVYLVENNVTLELYYVPSTGLFYVTQFPALLNLDTCKGYANLAYALWRSL